LLPKTPKPHRYIFESQIMIHVLILNFSPTLLLSLFTLVLWDLIPLEPSNYACDFYSIKFCLAFSKRFILLFLLASSIAMFFSVIGAIYWILPLLLLLLLLLLNILFTWISNYGIYSFYFYKDCCFLF
jgi:hypothetical protein